jgi:hypothetical protein
MEKNNEIIEEIIDEIENALKDPKGVISHQRRLAFLLSLGAVHLIESYLKKLNVFKSGAKINHLWLKKKKENAKKLIIDQIACPIENLSKIDKLLDNAYDLEKERNELAYGKKVSEEKLKEKIEIFLDLKKEVENA